MNEEHGSTSVRSTIKAVRARVVNWLPHDDWLVLGWVFATKILLLLFGVASYQALEDEKVPFGWSWLEIWNEWDAVHFLRLAEFGYSAADKFKAWFYPFYPWCVRFTSYLCNDFLLAAFLVSAVALFFAVVILRRIALLEWNAEIARRTVYFFLIFPTAFYLHIGYTESLFLALALGSIFAARKERWWLAGVLGAFSWMTRANGIVLLPTLVYPTRATRINSPRSLRCVKDCLSISASLLRNRLILSLTIRRSVSISVSPGPLDPIPPPCRSR